MTHDLLTPKILAALANQPTWTVVTPSATSPSTEPPTTVTPEAARMMSGSTTAPLDAAHVAPKCPRCHGMHRLEQCPQVKSIEYYEDGSVRRVEFHETPRPLEPSTPWWRDNSSWHVAERGGPCPKCGGLGRVPFFLPLATEPMKWDTCDQCHGHGMVWDWLPSAVSTSDTGSWSSRSLFDRPDEEE